MAKYAHSARLRTYRLCALSEIRAPCVKDDVAMSWFVHVNTRLDAQGIPARGYFAPIHTQPYIRDLYGDLSGTLPVTESIATRTLALPFHNNLTEAQVETVVNALEKAIGRA